MNEPLPTPEEAKAVQADWIHAHPAAKVIVNTWFAR